MRPIIGITTCRDRAPVTTNPPGDAVLFVSRAYVEAVEGAGGLPLLLPMLRGFGQVRELARLLDGLLVTGGELPRPDEPLRRGLPFSLQEQSPQRYRQDRLWVRQALQRKMPILGICRGEQMLNEVTGGSLYLQLSPLPEDSVRHVQPEPPDETSHSVEVQRGSRLHEILRVSRLPVNSFHSQAVKRPGPGMRVAARSPDHVVEAIESERHPFVIGVQFHPERLLWQPAMQRLFRAFCRAAADYAEKGKEDEGGK